MSGRPYQVGDRVRVRSDEGMPWHEGPVRSIDAQGYLFISTAPWIQSDGSEVDVDFVILNDDRTDAAFDYQIQRVEGEADEDPHAQIRRVRELAAQWGASDVRYQYDLPWAARQLLAALDGGDR